MNVKTNTLKFIFMILYTHIQRKIRVKINLDTYFDYKNELL